MLENLGGSSNCQELSRLMSAAMVNRAFCKQLLTDPALALAQGCGGEKFHLTVEQRKLVLSIRASTLVEFARQLFPTDEAAD